MRFGQEFYNHQVPEWASWYLPYDNLKHTFNKDIIGAVQRKSKADFTEIFFSLQRSIEHVTEFYNQKNQFLKQRQHEYCALFGITPKKHGEALVKVTKCCQLQELLGAIIEVRGEFEKLQQYFKVNAEAVNRIHLKIARYASTKESRQQNLEWLERKAKYETLGAEQAESLQALISNILCSVSLTGSCLKHDSELLSSPEGKSSNEALISEILRRIILEDNTLGLQTILEGYQHGSHGQNVQGLVYKLIKLSMTNGSNNSLGSLLSEAIPNHTAQIESHVLIRILFHLTRRGFLKGKDGMHCSSCGGHNYPDEKLVNCVLEAIERFDLKPSGVLLVTDGFGRNCLHYGALYGLQIICQRILERCIASDTGDAVRLVLSVDSQGYTPLHYALINNHTALVVEFLAVLEPESIDGSENSTTNDLAKLMNELLLIAIRYQCIEIVHLLGRRCADSYIESDQSETPLYTAVRIGNLQAVDALLKAGWVKYINTIDLVRGWTPLFVACAQGNEKLARLLLQAGAREDIADDFGWTAKEHAAFRGELILAEMLGAHSKISSSSRVMSFKPPSEAEEHGLHNYTQLIITLGTTQRRNHVKAVALNASSERYLHLSGNLSLEVSVSDGIDSNRAVELPILTDMINDPFVFRVSDLERSWMSFKFYYIDPLSAKGRNLLGSGASSVREFSNYFGMNRESLIRDRTVPILESETLSILGTVTFSLLVVSPMTSVDFPERKFHEFSTSNVQLVGHRGLGQNTSCREYLQLGENTIESFRSAVKQGATYVEFDVQLTRDLVPVVYHDFSLSESGTDIPIHDLTLEQFMNASKLQLPRTGPVSSPGNQDISLRGVPKHTRSRSREMDSESCVQEVRSRLLHTVDFMNKGFKPNTRGEFIQCPFVTLEDVLAKLPESVGLNMEIKYPRIHEAAEAGITPVAIEINTFLNKILEKVLLQAGATRNVILSSFTPEICILLACKQRTYPVMFITNAGKPPVADLDIRGSSLQSAVRFAKRWGLSGIVFASEVLIGCPRLITYVKQAGLKCGSYGPQNNVPENARMQAEAGIDLLMVDRVRLISLTLSQ